MDASPCGHCLIINNVEFEPCSDLNNRKGSDVDCDKLERRFKALNFIVEVKTNLRQRVGTFFICPSSLRTIQIVVVELTANPPSFQQIKHELLALSKKDHSQYDCCVVIILSHGTEVRHALRV